jgi:microcin C transport system substrate-binding protein
MTWASWSAALQKDPEGMWHSKEADRPSGNNVTGFRNNEVDALIEKQRGIFDIQARRDILRQIDSILTEEVPYVLLWYIDYTRMLYWNKFGTPETVLTKYGTESSAPALWWIDPDAMDDLAAARESGDALPPHPRTVMFDETFHGPAQ